MNKHVLLSPRKHRNRFRHYNRCGGILSERMLTQAQRYDLHTFKLSLIGLLECFGCSTPTQMQEPKANALVKPLSGRVCNSPLEPICILTQTYTCTLSSSEFLVQMCVCPQACVVGECWRAMTLCSGFSLGWRYKSLCCHVFLWSASLLSSGEPQRAREREQREAKRFKGWQQHYGLEVLSLPLTVLEREGGGGEEGEKACWSDCNVAHVSYFVVFFSLSLCGAG